MSIRDARSPRLVSVVVMGTVASLLAILASSQPVRGQEPEEDVELGDTETSTEGRVQAELQPKTSTDAASAAQINPAGPRLFWVAIPVWAASGDSDDGNHGFCRGWRYVAGDTPEEADRLRTVGENAFHHTWGVMIAPGFADVERDVDCPTDPADLVPPSVLRDAIRGVVIEQLPRPEPEIPPGWALTGLPAFLVTHHALDFQPDPVVIDLGPFAVTAEVHATGTTTVDWGDGSHPTTHLVPGTPWPDGQVNHTYRDAGTVTVTVTDTWQVEFRVVDPVVITDTVQAELAARIIDDFEVRELQAVRTTPGT